MRSSASSSRPDCSPDRTIARLIDEGRIGIDPYDVELLQPSSVDVRVDRYFRVFHNARYPYIDVKQAQETMVADKDPKRAGGDLSGGWGNLGTGGITQLPMDRIRGTTDFRELMNDPNVDVIDICVPTPSRRSAPVPRR